MMGITEIVLVVAGSFPCEDVTDTWLLIAPLTVVVLVAVGIVGRPDPVDWTCDCEGTTFITTFFNPLRIPATGLSLMPTGFATVPTSGGLLACNWLSEARALIVISELV